MGEIYLAEDRELGRLVAVKLLAERFARDDSLRERFTREALMAARLSGERHIVTIYDVGEWNARPFIVMAYLSGGTLAQRAREGPIDREDALLWLEQAAAALDSAHALGIVHRDVKPANLLFDEHGDIHVADFGVARLVDETTRQLTAAGTILGTAGYISPEQARGEQVSTASDLYGLGVVAYELLTGGRPFERGSATAEALAHVHEPVPSASQRGVGLPPAVDAVFERALAKNAADRFASAAELVAALRTALGGYEERTRTMPAVAMSSPPGVRPVRRHSPVWLPLLLSALVAALAAGALAGVLLTRGGGEPAPPRTQPAVTAEPLTVTETMPGTTVVRTVTTPQTTPGGSAGGGIGIAEAVRLTDQSTFALRRSDWADALRLAERAYPALARTYRDDFRYEAYVNYNRGKALAELGRCGEALPYLERSEDLQGHRTEIDEARAQCD
jgi:serine/threonine-protein kinase